MPTTRQRRTRKLRKLDPLADWQIEYLQTGVISAEVEATDPWGTFIFKYGGSTASTLCAEDTWLHVRDEIMDEWIAKHPGSRPWAWWQFDSQENRLRLGGTGTPRHEKLNYAPSYSFGIPAMVDVDESDPPVFESEADYLKRLP